MIKSEDLVSSHGSDVDALSIPLIFCIADYLKDLHTDQYYDISQRLYASWKDQGHKSIFDRAFDSHDIGPLKMSSLDNESPNKLSKLESEDNAVKPGDSTDQADKS